MENHIKIWLQLEVGMLLMTSVDQGQEVGLRAWGLNHCVCEEKADIYQEWTGTNALLPDQPYTTSTQILQHPGKGYHTTLALVTVRINTKKKFKKITLLLNTFCFSVCDETVDGGLEFG